MNSTIVLVTVAIAVPVMALGVWFWAIAERVNEEFRAELESIHFEV
jgi:nitrogen fixation-related uncharacterized protein